MQQNIIVLITGMPGTGKTTLGKALSKKYHFPLISKDALKERMFNTLGWSDKAWSLKLSAASHRVMDYIIEEQLSSGQSVIVESNFKHDIDSERFANIQRKYNCALVQILCHADGEVVFQRFMERIGTPDRHEGHVEDISPEEIRKGFIEVNGKDTPLDIGGETIALDTTNLQTIDYETVYQAIEAALTDK